MAMGRLASSLAFSWRSLLGGDHGMGHADVSAKPWEVWDELNCRRFVTLAGAERYAHGKVRSTGRQVEICRDGYTVAYVRPDALNRVWTDVVDGTVA